MSVARDHRCSVDIGPETRPVQRLVVNVLFTSERETSAAFATANKLARDLDADIRILSFQIVPYPLDLTRPDVAPSFMAARCAALSRSLPVEAHFRICYCRDVAAAVGDALAPNSLIVLGRKKQWWPRRDSRLIRHLRSSGRDLVVVEVR